MSGRVIEVLGSHRRADVLFAHRVSDVDRGIVTVDAPAISAGTSVFLRHVLRALDAPPPPMTPDVASDHALALAWLHALAIRDLVIVHADWLAGGLAFETLRALAGAGIDVYLLSQRKQGSRRSTLRDGWCGATWAWERFASWASARGAEETPPARALGEALPVLGLRGTACRVPPLAGPAGPAATAYDAVRLRGRPDRPSWQVARVVRRLLDPGDTAREPAVLAGIAAALDEIGYLLVEVPEPQPAPTWRALQRLGDPQGPACLGIFAAGASPRVMAQLRIVDVAADGSRVQVGTRELPVPSGARPFVQAQRLVRLALGRQPRDVLFAEGSYPMTVDQVRALLAGTLASVNTRLGPRDVAARAAPSQQWLWARGLTVERTPRADSLAVERAEAEAAQRSRARDPRCRHGLRTTVVAGQQALSHSYRLCRAQEPEETRPVWRGYAVRQVEARGGARTWRVSQDGVEAGWLWSVETPLGRAWLEKGGGQVPTLAEVAQAVDAMQHDRRPTEGGPRAGLGTRAT